MKNIRVSTSAPRLDHRRFVSSAQRIAFWLIVPICGWIAIAFLIGRLIG